MKTMRIIPTGRVVIIATEKEVIAAHNEVQMLKVMNLIASAAVSCLVVNDIEKIIKGRKTRKREKF